MQFSLGSDVALERETNLHTSVVGYSVSTGKIVPVLIKYLHQAQAYTSPSVLGFTTESFNGNTRANTLKRKSLKSRFLQSREMLRCTSCCRKNLPTTGLRKRPLQKPPLHQKKMTRKKSLLYLQANQTADTRRLLDFVTAGCETRVSTAGTWAPKVGPIVPEHPRSRNRACSNISIYNCVSKDGAYKYRFSYQLLSTHSLTNCSNLILQERFY